jgi:hypothetical protein
MPGRSGFRRLEVDHRFEFGRLHDGQSNAALADCRAHLAKPDMSFTMYTVAQVWARTPVTA